MEISVSGQNLHLVHMPVILGNKAGIDIVTNQLLNMAALIAMVT